MKGEMFVLAALIILAGVLIARISIRAPSIAQRRASLEATLEDKLFDNIFSEFSKVPVVSGNEPANISENLYNFTDFIDERIGEKLFTFNALVVGSFAQANSLNVSVINFLSSAKNFTLNLNGTTKYVYVARKNRNYTSFSITPGLIYVLTLSFTGYEQHITIKTYADKNVYVNFFDVYLKSDRGVYRNKKQASYLFG